MCQSIWCFVRPGMVWLTVLARNMPAKNISGGYPRHGPPQNHPFKNMNAETAADIWEILSIYFQSRPVIVPDLSTCSNSSKKCGMAIFYDSIHPPIEMTQPLRKPTQFMLYRAAPLRKQERLKKGIWKNVRDRSPLASTDRVGFTNRICLKWNRNDPIFNRLLPTRCIYYQKFIGFRKIGWRHWFSWRYENILHIWRR